MADEEKVTDTQTGGVPDKGGTESGNPTTGTRTFTQSEVDQIVKQRLEREKQRVGELAEEARKKAEAEAAAKNGEWQKLAEQREAELKQAKAEAREANIRAQAARMGMADLDYAVFLVSKAGENADAEAVLKEWQSKNPTQQQTTQQTSGSSSPTNPDTSSGKVFSRSQLRDPVFFQANKEAILLAAREGRIKED